MSGGSDCGASSDASALDDRVNELMVGVGMQSDDMRIRVRSLISLAVDMADPETRVAFGEFVGSCTRQTKRRREAIDLTLSPAAGGADDQRSETAIAMLRGRVPKFPIIMVDGSIAGMEEIMTAWTAAADVNERFDTPFKLTRGGPLLTITRETSKLQRHSAVLREVDPAADVFTFFRLHYRRAGDAPEVWQLYPFSVHIAFAKLVAWYIKQEELHRQMPRFVRNLVVGDLGLECIFTHQNGARRLAFSMTRPSPTPDRMLISGWARLTFKDHAMGRRIFAEYEFPVVQILDKQEEGPAECPICMETVDLDLEFSGCGHRIHDGCMAALHPKVCYLCRTKFVVPGDD